MRSPSVDLEGDFARDEARFLSATFDHCRISLIARSRLDVRIALVRWAPSFDAPHDRVTDPRRVPASAFYVLTGHPDMALTAVASNSELQAAFPGHFPDQLVPAEPIRRGCLPALFGGGR